jgi:hypothetical protein
MIFGGKNDLNDDTDYLLSLNSSLFKCDFDTELDGPSCSLIGKVFFFRVVSTSAHFSRSLLVTLLLLNVALLVGWGDLLASSMVVSES